MVQRSTSYHPWASKPFKCSKCRRKFASEKGRDQHFRDSHSTAAYLHIPCDTCDEKFKNKRERDDHVRRVHGQDIAKAVFAELSGDLEDLGIQSTDKEQK